MSFFELVLGIALLLAPFVLWREIREELRELKQTRSDWLVSRSSWLAMLLDLGWKGLVLLVVCAVWLIVIVAILFGGAL